MSPHNVVSIDALLTRVRESSPDALNQAITEDDVGYLSTLSPDARADALTSLGRLGIRIGTVKERLKDLHKKRARLRAVEEDEAVDGWADALRRTREGDPLPVVDNLERILRCGYAGRLSFDLMSKCPCLDDRPLDDVDITRLRADIGTHYRSAFTTLDMRAACVLVGMDMKSFHPVQDYLRGLTHDTVPRLATAARDHLSIFDPFANIVLRRTLIAAVARGLVQEHAPEEGVLVKTVPIVLGYQDAKKSTFFRTLGGPWFGDSEVDISHRHGLMTLSSKWIYELAEVDGLLAKHTNEKTKAFTGRTCDDYVPMFGTKNIKVPRGWILVGTSNKDRFLTDPTGSTRWHILNLLPNGPLWEVDVYKLRAARDQLFAEAVAEFDRFLELQKTGVRDDDNPHRWWLNRDENAMRAERAVAYQVEDAWAETVSRWLAGEALPCNACKGRKTFGSQDCSGCDGRGKVEREELAKDELGKEYVTLARILTEALAIPPERHRTCTLSLTNTLAELGWYPGERIRVAGLKLTPYYERKVGTIEDDDREAIVNEDPETGAEVALEMEKERIGWED